MAINRFEQGRQDARAFRPKSDEVMKVSEAERYLAGFDRGVYEIRTEAEQGLARIAARYNVRGEVVA